MKRIVTIQDISCLGKCSLTVALPIISATGVEASIIPTAVLSTHTMFKEFTFKDLSDQIYPIVNHWQKENITFDGLYTGYLGSIEQIDMIKEIFKMFKTKDNFTFVDPVMADNGKLYPNFDEAYVKKNTELCEVADYIVPNITEACLMTGMEYKEDYDEQYIHDLLYALAKKGGHIIVVTGVSLEEGKLGFMSYDVDQDEFYLYQADKIEKSYHGTGDIFSSVAVGCLARGVHYKKAFQIAADYTALTIKKTLENPANPWYGVDFELTIPSLVQMIQHVEE